MLFLLLSFPTAIFCATATITIIATNDIHGSAFPTVLSKTDGSTTYNYGGLEFMANMIRTLQMENQGNVLYLDSGDQFQGGIQSSKLVSSGEIMSDFFTAVNLDASAIGNHEFDFGPVFLLPYLSKKTSRNLAANIRSESGQSEFLPKQQKSTIYTFQNGINIGVIGLSTIETPTTTSGFGAGANKFPKYQFLDYKDIVIKQSQQLRKKGAKAIIVLSHVGNACPYNQTYGHWTQSSQQKPCSNDEINQLIDALPQGTIDVVLQGHRHSFAHNFYKGVAISGTINGGYYFNALYLTFEDGTLTQKQIQGPIPVCEKIFSKRQLCNYIPKSELQAAGQLVKWKFHRVQVKKDEIVSNFFSKKWMPKMKPFLEPMVKIETVLKISKTKQCQLANLFTNLIHQAVPTADFVVLNPGGFRTIWLPGTLLYQQYYNMIPFDSQLISFDIKGKQLLDTLKIIQAGSKGLYHFYGINQVIKIHNSGARQFISAQFTNGSIIQPSQTYRGVTIDFLLSGGDDFNKVIGSVYSVRKEQIEGEMRQLLKPKLIALGTVHSDTLIDPTRPRITIIKQTD